MSDKLELYKKYRPSSLQGLVGQEEAVQFLTSSLEDNSVPHTVLFTGPAGTGKTTLARILASELECHEGDLQEINAATERGIEMVRSIKQRLHVRPMMSGSRCRVWLLDEVHKLSSDAQSALLKILEDTPRHVYFFMATTDPQKLTAAIRSRSTHVKLSSLTSTEILKLVKRVCKREKAKLPDEEVLDKLVDASEGSARTALVYLQQVLAFEDDESQLNVLSRVAAEEEGITVARTLFGRRKPQWAEMAKVLREVKEDPETIRWIVLSYAKSILLKKADARAHEVIVAFEDNFYDSKMAGLVRACYDVCGPK